MELAEIAGVVLVLVSLSLLCLNILKIIELWRSLWRDDDKNSSD